MTTAEHDKLARRVARGQRIVQMLGRVLLALVAAGVGVLLWATFDAAGKAKTQSADLKRIIAAQQAADATRLLDEKKRESDAAAALAALDAKFASHDAAVRRELSELLARARIIVERVDGQTVIRIVAPTPAPQPSPTPCDRPKGRCR